MWYKDVLHLRERWQGSEIRHRWEDLSRRSNKKQDVLVSDWMWTTTTKRQKLPQGSCLEEEWTIWDRRLHGTKNDKFIFYLWVSNVFGTYQLCEKHAVGIASRTSKKPNPKLQTGASMENQPFEYTDVMQAPLPEKSQQRLFYVLMLFCFLCWIYLSLEQNFPLEKNFKEQNI